MASSNGAEGPGVRSEPPGNVVDQPARGSAPVGWRETARKAKKAEYARKRYWEKKGQPPPPGDGRSLRAEAPPRADRPVDPESGSDEDDLVAEDAPVRVAPPPEADAARARRSLQQKKLPPKKRQPGLKAAEGGWSKLLVGGALIAAGLWFSNAQRPVGLHAVAEKVPAQVGGTPAYHLPQLSAAEAKGQF